MSVKELIERTSLANIVAGTCILVGLAYFFVTKNTDGMLFLTGCGTGWLFKEIKE